MAPDQPDPQIQRRVLVIGLDGATFDLIKPWVAEGRLPTLRLLEELFTDRQEIVTEVSAEDAGSPRELSDEESYSPEESEKVAEGLRGLGYL
jgi:hypothetical protein